MAPRQNARGLAAPQLELALAEPGRRANRLARDRDRLVKEIARRKDEFVRIERDLVRAREQIFRVLDPFFGQQADLEAEIHASFAVLLSPGRLSKKKRSGVRSIY